MLKQKIPVRFLVQLFISVSIVLLALLLAPASAEAAYIVETGNCGGDGNLNWTFDSEGTLTITGTGDMPGYERSDGYRPGWYYGYPSPSLIIKRVVIEDGVTSVGNYAFADFPYIESVELPEGLTYIGKNAFFNCTSLVWCEIPSTVSQIDSHAFANCTSFPGTVLPEGITKLSESVLEGCTSLASLTIPSTVTTIENRAVFKCTSLKEVVIPDKVISIGDFSFYECNSLENLYISDRVQYIGEGAFAGCKALKEIIVGNGITSIGSLAFLNSDNAKLYYRGTEDKWNSIIMSVEGCPALTRPIYSSFGKVSDTLTWTLGEDGTLLFTGSGPIPDYENAESVPWHVKRENIKEIVFRPTINYIGDYTFYGCTSLEKVYIPEKVLSLGNYAFYGCSSLVLCDLPHGLWEEIGDYAFAECSSLKDVFIGARYIGDGAYMNCTSVKRIEFYADAKHIGKNAFSGCTALKSLFMRGNDASFNIETIGEDAFANCPALTDVCAYTEENEWAEIEIAEGNEVLEQVQIFSKEQPKSNITCTLSADGVLTISGSGNIPNGMANVPWNNMRNQIKSVVIENGVTSIGIDSFALCPNLESVTLPESLLAIYSGAFYQCSELKEVTFPDSVLYLDYSVFNGCTSLQTLVIGSGVTRFSYNNILYLDKPPLSEIYYKGTKKQWGEIVHAPEEYGEIQFRLMGTCGDNLTFLMEVDGTLTISGEGVIDTFICDDGSACDFSKEKLTTIIIEEGVTGVGSWLLNDCSYVTKVVLPGTLTSIGSPCFDNIPDTAQILYNDIEERWNSIEGNSVFDSVAFCVGAPLDEDHRWVIRHGGILYVRGDGAMENYSPSAPAGWYAYRDSIKSIQFDDTVTAIGDYAFYDLNNLEKIEIPAHISRIGVGAYMGCDSITAVTIPAHITSIGQAAFAECADLSEFSVENGNEHYAAEGGVLFSKDKTQLLVFPYAKDVFEYRVPDTVTTIGNYAFYNIVNFEFVALNNVTHIGDYAFAGSHIWVDMLNSSSVETIGDYAFYNTLRAFSFKMPDTVISIGDFAFSGVQFLNTYGSVINDGVQHIGKDAFSGCTGIKTVSIPLSLTTWDYAFRNCVDLCEVGIPEGFEKIADGAFSGCSMLTVVPIPKTITVIGDEAFKDSGLVRVVAALNDINVEVIGKDAFSGCESFFFVAWTTSPIGFIPPDVYFPSVHTIGEGAFNGCSSMIEVSFPAVKNIGANAFSGCAALWSLELPDMLDTLGAGAFSGCKSIESFTIPSGISAIASNTFSGSGLTQIVIPENITEISSGAFKDCASLTDVTIDTGVANIGENAFSGCGSLTGVWYRGTGEQWSEININKNGNDCLEYVTFCKSGTMDDGLTWTIRIGDSGGAVLVISGNGAMHGFNSVSETPWASDAASLTGLIVEEGITAVGANAFSGCVQFADVMIANSVATIGENAFSGCSNIKAAEFDGSERDIIFESGNDALTSALSYLRQGTYGTDLVFNWAVTRDRTLTISGNGDMPTDTAQLTMPWSPYASIVKSLVIKEGVTGINTSAFSRFAALTDISLPNSLKNIGVRAFEYCYALPEIEFPDSVEEIGGLSFQSCHSLEKVVLPEGLTVLERQTFLRCRALTSIEMPAGLEKIETQAFSDCTSLKEIVIPDGVTEIGSHAFVNCSSLTKAVLPKALITIKEYAFDKCSSLNSIDLPEGLTQIGNWAFRGCALISDITIPKSVTSVGTEAFLECIMLSSVQLPCSWIASPLYTFDKDVQMAYTHGVITFEKDEDRENVILIRCSEEEEISEIIIKAPANPVHTGQPVEAVLTFTHDGISAPEIHYEALDGGSLTNGKPVEPGRYKAAISLDGATASITYEIENAPVLTPVSVLGGYADKMSVAVSRKNNEITFAVMPEDDYELPELTVHTVVYDDSGMVEALEQSYAPEDDGLNINITLQLPQTEANESFKIMIWDDKLTPLISSVDGTYLDRLPE